MFKTVLKVLPVALLMTACNQVDFKKTKAGIPYKVLGSEKGELIKAGQIVRFEVMQKKNDSLLFSTYTAGQSQFMQVNASNEIGTYADLGSNVPEIFLKARKGDSIYIEQAADSIIAKSPEMAASINLKKGDKIKTTVRIVDVYKTPEEANNAYNKMRVASSAQNEQRQLAAFSKDTMVQRQMAIDNKIIEDYLASKNIQTTKTPWGVYVQVLNPGSGPKPEAGQWANVKYKGTDLQGNQFDAGTYPLQIGLGGSIKGFEEGVKQLSKGGKAIVYIPSMLAYGPNGSAPKIKPNQVLVFELEMLDITNTQPVPQSPMTADTVNAKGK